MQRYFLRNEQFQDEKVNIYGDEAHHISRVMRMKVGTPIICCNENGEAAKCELEEITNEQVIAHIVKWDDEQKELPVKVTISQGLPKGDKLELIVQKGTELGASGFLPFFSARSIVKWDEKKGRKKVERLQKIAKEAAEQSHRNFVPEVQVISSLKELIAKSEDFTHKLIAYEEDAKAGEKGQLATTLSSLQPGDSILIVIGPEGGLAEGEVLSLKENGFESCSLGPRILRTETAPFYFLSAVSYQTELLR